MGKLGHVQGSRLGLSVTLGVHGMQSLFFSVTF